MADLYYGLVGFLAVLILALTNYGFLRTNHDTKPAKVYKQYLYSVFFFFLSDSAWGVINYFDNYPLLYIDTVVYNIALLVSVLFCCRYIIAFLNLHDVWQAVLNSFGEAFLWIGVLMLGVNFFYPVYFYFDEMGEYHTCLLRHVAVLVLLALFMTVSTISFFESAKMRGSSRHLCRTIYYFSMSMIVGLLLQFFFPNFPFYTLSVLLGTLINHFFIQEYERDIQFTKISRLNLALERAVKKAEAANNSKTIFLNNISHDIRTPMNAILGFADLLESKKDDPAMMDDYVDKIKTSGKYLLTIINNVLDMARIESGQMTLNEEFYDMCDQGYTIFPIFESLIRKKNLHVQVKEDIEHRYLWVDGVKMNQVMANLLGNAVKYTPDNGNIRLEFSELPCERVGYARIKVVLADSGIGMSKEFLEHIFDRFSRERNTTDSKVVGSGLGMSIAKKLVELQGGTLSVESELGKGTTFTIVIEHRIFENAEDYLAQHDEKEKHRISLENKHFLLAEDNDLNAEIISTILDDMGAVVDRAENGEVCVNMLEAAAPDTYDIILMDVQMPVLDGYEATRRIRSMKDAAKSEIQIVAMTANAFEEDRKRAIEAGMNAHLTKPVEVPKLITVLEQCFLNSK